ncbi:MAG: hypothetical protein ACR2N6_02545, partial [Miltoncostaeaceae bacterium]
APPVPVEARDHGARKGVGWLGVAVAVALVAAAIALVLILVDDNGGGETTVTSPGITITREGPTTVTTPTETVLPDVVPGDSDSPESTTP